MELMTWKVRKKQDTNASISTSDDSFQKCNAPTARFVDNKRKMLEKNLSGNQRDQVFLNLAKDQVLMKQKLIDGLTEAKKESNKALESISQSMVAVGEAIEDGLALLPTGLSGAQTQQAPRVYAEYSPAPHNYPDFQFSNSLAEIFLMIITESRFRARKMKHPDAIHHRIYTVHRNKYANAK